MHSHFAQGKIDESLKSELDKLLSYFSEKLGKKYFLVEVCLNGASLRYRNLKTSTSVFIVFFRKGWLQQTSRSGQLFTQCCVCPPLLQVRFEANHSCLTESFQCCQCFQTWRTSTTTSARGSRRFEKFRLFKRLRKKSWLLRAWRLKQFKTQPLKHQPSCLILTASDCFLYLKTKALSSLSVVRYIWRTYVSIKSLFLSRAYQTKIYWFLWSAT